MERDEWMGKDFCNGKLETFYDKALICSNGHIINDSISELQERNLKFCEQCGSESLSLCPNCNIELKGALIDNILIIYGRIYQSLEKAPSFCYNCGNIFPWTISKIEAAIELVFENNNIEDFDKDKFGKDLIEISKETPMANVSAIRIKKIMKGITNGARKMVYDLIVSIASETIKKVIFPDSK